MSISNSGVYVIENTINGHRYIGSTINLVQRKAQHFRALRSGNNNCKVLQHAFDKYKETNFIFKLLLICESYELLRYEQGLIDAFCPEYNISPTASSQLGVKRSEETRRKISEAKTGKKMPPKSEELRRKISEANRRRFSSKEARRKVSEKHKGTNHKFSEQGLENLVVANKARVWSVEDRARMSEIKRGHIVSDETRRKISETKKRRLYNVVVANSSGNDDWGM
jgi:group I intron endonuclease